MAEQLKKTDVVLVGVGAAGGVAAFALTKAGLNVIGIEAGGRLTGRDEKLNDLAGPGRYNIFGRPKANLEIPTWRPNASTPTIPATANGARPTPMMNAVGGSSIHYATDSWRLNPWNFKTRSETIKRYGAGAIPKGSTVADWPLTYEELEPHYDKAEYEIGISGKAGNIQGKLDPAGNIFEGPRMREYPLPPLRSASWSEFIAGAARRLGWHPFPNPSSIHSQPWKGTPACTYCSSCGNGCFIGAKGSTDIHVIPAAEKTKKLTIVTEARVTRIEVDNQGRASGVTYLKDGREYFQPASVVVLGSFTYENVRLLLLSTSKAYPKGLSNNQGQVGRNYMAHNTAQIVEAFFPGKKLNKYGVPSRTGPRLTTGPTITLTTRVLASSAVATFRVEQVEGPASGDAAGGTDLGVCLEGVAEGELGFNRRRQRSSATRCPTKPIISISIQSSRIGSVCRSFASLSTLRRTTSAQPHLRLKRLPYGLRKPALL